MNLRLQVQEFDNTDKNYQYIVSGLRKRFDALVKALPHTYLDSFESRYENIFIDIAQELNMVVSFDGDLVVVGQNQYIVDSMLRTEKVPVTP